MCNDAKAKFWVRNSLKNLPEAVKTCPALPRWTDWIDAAWVVSGVDYLAAPGLPRVSSVHYLHMAETAVERSDNAPGTGEFLQDEKKKSRAPHIVSSFCLAAPVFFHWNGLYAFGIQAVFNLY